MPLTPYHIEPFTTGVEVKARIDSVGGQLTKQEAHRHTYFAGRINAWLAVERNPAGGFFVKFYTQCPCGG